MFFFYKKEIKIVLLVIEFDYRYVLFYVSIMVFCDCNMIVCMYMYWYMIKLFFLKYVVFRYICFLFLYDMKNKIKFGD